MYAARPHVLALSGGKCWKNSDYLTQELLPRFMVEHPEVTADWDVIFDDRGHFVEPHTRHRIWLGTLTVRRYIRDWHEDVPSQVEMPEIDQAYPTMGPGNRFRYALFLKRLV